MSNPVEWAPSLRSEARNAWGKIRDQIDLAPCNGCSQCRIRCAEGVQMTRFEYETVMRHAESLNSARLRAVLAQDKTVELGEGVEARMCRYLDMDGGGCAVYPARPLVCRLLGHVEWLPCPIEKIEKPAETADALALMKTYSKEERLTFEQWEERFSRE